MEFKYASKPPRITATFTVIWDGAKPLDNPHNIHIVIYRCHDMADSCGMCLVLPAKYGCGWCSSSNCCEVEEQCKGTEGTVDWLNRLHTCPNPEIHSFAPRCGPWEGGTNITIKGINLGMNFADIYSGVKIVGIDCLPYRELYLATREIVCRVDSPGTMAYRAGKIVVQIQDYRGESRGDFEFVDPVIHDFEPKSGPISGGTRIHIRGLHLNAGSLIKASINGLKCEILATHAKDAFCRTSPSKILSKGFLKMEFDSGERQLNSVPFEYVADPIIDYATSGGSGQKVPKGIPSGGVKIIVFGRNFKSTWNPSMYVYFDSQQFTSSCVVITDDEMVCISPVFEIDSLKAEEPIVARLTSEVSEYALQPYHRIFDAIELQISSDAQLADPAFLSEWNAGNTPIRLEYGFIMDDVSSTKNLSAAQKPFELYPNRFTSNLTS
jgi:plexin A